MDRRHGAGGDGPCSSQQPPAQSRYYVKLKGRDHESVHSVCALPRTHPILHSTLQGRRTRHAI